MPREPRGTDLRPRAQWRGREYVGTALRSHASDPYLPSNETGDCEIMKMLLNCFASYEQSDWPKKAITVFIITLNIHDAMSLTRDHYWGILKYPIAWHIIKGEQVNNLMIIWLLRDTTHQKMASVRWLVGLVGLLCLTPLSAIFQLYHGDQF